VLLPSNTHRKPITSITVVLLPFVIYLLILHRILLVTVMTLKSRVTSVSIATGYVLDRRGSIPGRGKKHFSTSQRPDRLWFPPILLYNCYRGFFFHMGKRQEREADH
jgi:hypothetical protein